MTNTLTERNKMVHNGTISGDLPEKTRARYEQIANLMLLGSDIGGICRYGRISRSALYRLFRRDDFKQVLREVRQAVSVTARQAIAGLLEEAIELVGQTIRDESAPLTLRLRAAQIVIQSVTEDPSAGSPRMPVPTDNRHVHVHIQKENFDA